MGAGAAATAGAGALRFVPEWVGAQNAKSQGRRRKWVMVIDLERCDGCRKCTEACIEEHNVPQTWGGPGYNGKQQWIEVVETNPDPKASGRFLPTPCMNCENAPCVKVCPVGATYYNEDAIVLIDNTRCIGCRFCMAACPYSRRFFNWGEPEHGADEQFIQYSPDYPVPHRKGTVEKCIFCAHRVSRGRLPACVEACTKAGMKAIYFGDANEDAVSNGEEVVRLSELLDKRGGFRLKEEFGTDPSVYYLHPGGH